MCLVNDTDSSGVCIYIHRLGEEYVCGCNVCGCMYVHMDPKMCECVWLMILIVVVCVCIYIGWVRSMSAGVMYVGVYVCGCVCMCIWIQRCVSVSG